MEERSHFFLNFCLSFLLNFLLSLRSCLFDSSVNLQQGHLKLLDMIDDLLFNIDNPSFNSINLLLNQFNLVDVFRKDFLDVLDFDVLVLELVVDLVG